jgi:hypothetical protein
MCPEAERILGLLADRDPQIVPIAFHVDYFNDPWKDPFSDKLYSERQAAYNAIYTKPKDAEYGLYYTPMVMVDGIQSVNGRDLKAIRSAVMQASKRKPKVALTTKLNPTRNARSCELQVNVSSRTTGITGRELLVCAVQREDRVITKVRSGENANKLLTARFAARSTQFEFITLKDGETATLRFPFRVEPTWLPERLGIAVFAQDKLTGEVVGSTVVRWPTRSLPGKKTPG